MALGKLLGTVAGVAGLGGLFGDINSQKKAYEAAQKQRQLVLDYINKMHGRTENQALDIYQQLANQGRQYQQAALDTQYNMLGPQINLMQDGNVAAQNYLQQALGGMNAGILGGALPQFSSPTRLDAQAYMPMAREVSVPNLLTMNFGGLRG